MIEILKQLTRELHKDAYLEIEAYKNRILEAKQHMQIVRNDLKAEHDKELTSLKTEHSTIIAKYDAQLDKLKAKQKNPIDKHLEKLFDKVVSIAYQQKRQINKTFYSIYLNELFTPNAYEVIKFKKTYISKADLSERMLALANKVAKHTTWVDEQKLYDTGDYYYFPAETLTGGHKTTDCDDVSFAIASFEPEVCAVVFGMYNDGKNRFGHAYPVFLYEGELYILEATGRAAELIKFNDPRYEPHILITQNETYRAKYGLNFGKLAEFIE
jgi:hypothetical protein